MYDENGESLSISISIEADATQWAGGLLIEPGDSGPPYIDVWLESSSPSGRSDYAYGSNYDLESGTIVVSDVSGEPGEAVRVVFEDARFGTLLLNGRVEDSLDGPLEIDRDALPLGDLEEEELPESPGEWVRYFDERCGPTLDDAIVLQFLDGFVDELASARVLLDRLIRVEGEAFSFTVPAGTFANPSDVPLGIVSALGMRASLVAQEALLEGISAYRFFGRGLESMIGPDGELDVQLVVDELNASFAETGQPVSWTPSVTDRWQISLQDGLIALGASPSAGSLVDLSKLPERTRFELSSGIVTLNDVIRGPTPLPLSPGYVLNPGDVFEAMPDRYTMRGQAGGDIWFLDQYDRIGFSETVAEWLVAEMVTLPEPLDEQLPCTQDGDCAPYGRGLVCGGYGSSGFCYSDPQLACDTDSDCPDFYCNYQICAVGPPQFFDTSVLDELPRFGGVLNDRAVLGAIEAFDAMGELEVIVRED